MIPSKFDILPGTVYSAKIVDPNTLLVDHGFGISIERDIKIESEAMLADPGTPVLLKIDRTSRRETRGEILPAGSIKPTYNYRASVVRVVDGDTAWFTATLWKGAAFHLEVRFEGINAPESTGPKACAEGKAAKEYVASVLVPGKEVSLATKKTDLYGRYLGMITVDSAPMSFNQQLIALGYAMPYDGKGKVS